MLCTRGLHPQASTVASSESGCRRPSLVFRRRADGLRVVAADLSALEGCRNCDAAGSHPHGGVTGTRTLASPSSGRPSEAPAEVGTRSAEGGRGTPAPLTVVERVGSVVAVGLGGPTRADRRSARSRSGRCRWYDTNPNVFGLTSRKRPGWWASGRADGTSVAPVALRWTLFVTSGLQPWSDGRARGQDADHPVGHGGASHRRHGRSR